MEGSAPHVLMFPLPWQGPINSMLKLAELLCLAGGIRVTFLNTLHNHRRLLRFSAAASRFSRYYPDSFRFETFPDGLPEHHPRSAGGLVEIVSSVEAAAKPLLRRILMAPGGATCFVSDGIFGSAVDVAEEFGVPLLYFETISPCCLSVFLSLPKLIQAQELPFDGDDDDDLDAPIRSVPGMESFLRRRDLPTFFRAGDLSGPVLRLLLTEAGKLPQARGLILNTFEELERSETLSHLRGICPDGAYVVGPLHSLLRARFAMKAGDAPAAAASSNSLWEEDAGCIQWLDSQPPRSVVYVSIGSLAVMTVDLVAEIRHGLVNSGHRFLWARRPGSVTSSGGDDDDDEEAKLVQAGATWRIVRWAPQEEVLGHAAVGAFLTHGGWNSTLESVAASVPMMCWPHFADQHVNSRHVSRAWGLGLDMKDTCDRIAVEGMVRDLMEARREEFFQSAQRTARLAKGSVTSGGTSSSNLDRLIEDIRLMGHKA